MITKIECTRCGGDLVRYAGNKQLECIPCGTTSFHAFHTKNEEVSEVRETIKKFKDVKDLKDVENFDELIKKLGKDFDNLFS